MTKKNFAAALAALCGLVLCAPVAAADATAPADRAKPATTPRVGGSPADAAFRAAQLKSGAAFRAARTACRAKPRAGRGTCMSAARAALKHAQVEAISAHASAKATR